MTTRYRPDELEAQAARAMLAALRNIVKAADAQPENIAANIDIWAKYARAIIGQAEAAGIRTED